LLEVVVVQVSIALLITGDLVAGEAQAALE
jgi:hypothetical protein